MNKMANDALRAELSRFQRLALIVGGVASLLCVVGAFLSPSEFLQAYLVAYVFWIGIPTASLGLLMVHNLAGGRWSGTLRSLFEAGTRTFPLMALLFVPIALGIYDLYEWADPAHVVGDHLLEHKAIYLNVPFFLGRTVFYFFVWMFLSFFLNRWTRQYEETLKATLPGRIRYLSGPALGFLGLTMTFAAFDWLMSLEPHWYSTIFGAMVSIGAVLTCFSFMVILVCWLAEREPFKQAVSPELLNDFGSLLLGFTMLWAYGALSQFLLIWSGNLAEEITWYLERSEGGWQWISILLMLLHFAIPFALLIIRDIKRNRRTLAAVATLLFFIRLVEAFWIVQPTFHASISIHWLDIVTPLAIGGLWFALFIRQLLARPLLPLYEPKLEGEKAHGEAAQHAI